jgi:hypothetical protein
VKVTQLLSHIHPESIMHPPIIQTLRNFQHSTLSYRELSHL